MEHKDPTSCKQHLASRTTSRHRDPVSILQHADEDFSLFFPPQKASSDSQKLLFGDAMFFFGGEEK